MRQKAVWQTSLAFRSAALAGLGVMAVELASTAHAASVTWATSPDDSNWVTTTQNNWGSAGAFPGSTSGTSNQDVATLLTSNATQININSTTLNVKSVTIGVSGSTSSAFTIGATSGGTAGNALYLTTGGTLGIANNVTAAVVNEQINAPLVLAPGTATGTYTLISGGGAGNTLTIAGNVNGGSTTSTTLSLAGTNAGGVGTISGNIGNGSAGGVLNLTKASSNQGTWYLSGNNTYTGKTSVLGGLLSVNSLNSVVGGTAASALGAPTTVANGTIDIGIRSSGATLQYTGSGETTDRIINIGADGTNGLDASGTGALKFTSDLSVLTVAGGANSSAKTLLLTGTSTVDNTFGGSIANGTDGTQISVTKTGTGTWVLSGTNTFSGILTVSGGTLALNGDNTLGSTNAITTSNGSNAATAIETRGADRTIPTLNTSGTLRIGGGHNLTVSTALNLTNPLTLTVDTGSTFTVTPSFGISNGAANRILSINGGGDVVLTGSIGNNTTGGTSTGSSITKNNTGLLTLSSGNTYGGTTNVTAGVLLANNPSATSASGTGTLNVTGGGVGGSGHVAPTGSSYIAFAAGTKITPGSAGAGNIGSLEFNLTGTTGSVTMSPGSGLQMNLGTAASTMATAGTSSTSDRLVVNGMTAGRFVVGTSAGGGISVDFLGTGDNGFYKLIDTDLAAATSTTDAYAGALAYNASTGQITAGLAASNLSSALGSATFFIGNASNGGDTGDIYVQISGVPEPTALAILGMGAVGLLRRRSKFLVSGEQA